MPAIGAVISSRMATLHELDTVYGLLDLHDMLEVLAVDAQNSVVVNSANGH
jgi:4-diphosphocytidyl-2C-methyl-D-erythritol kinase